MINEVCAEKRRKDGDIPHHHAGGFDADVDVVDVMRRLRSARTHAYAGLRNHHASCMEDGRMNALLYCCSTV